ncbi:MAG: phage tail protein [Burkholderiaceae bacterium]|nr:MAG: phage tail protein [Burkholderiaceae bacterium]
MADGALILAKSGRQRINDRVFRVAGSTFGTFNFEGLDTTDTKVFPAGGGVGSVQEITNFTQITRVLESSTSGGDMQFANYSFLENDFESQIPTQSSAQTLTLSIADDDTLLGYKALQKAAEARSALPLKAQLPNGAIILYMGYVSFNTTPSMTKGSVMACQATFSF